MAKRVAFTGKQQLIVEEFTPKTKLETGEVRVRGICSLISTGTENIVFNRLFDPGTHWDGWVKYPFYPGYSYIGEVTEIAAEVSGVKKGDRVAIRNGHATEHVVKAAECQVIPAGIASEDAAWFALGKITYAGARAAKYALGCNVLIIGGGPIGQLSARWALAAGAGKVVLVEPQEFRLELAKRGGVHAGVDKPLGECKDELCALFGGQLPEFVMDTTGAAPVFPLALDSCGRFGKVILLGDSGSPSKQCLTSAVITSGLTIVGAHDPHVTAEEGAKNFWAVLGDRRFRLDGMITHRYSIAQAEEAYTIANTRRGETMGILFDYAK